MRRGRFPSFYWKKVRNMRNTRFINRRKTRAGIGILLFTLCLSACAQPAATRPTEPETTVAPAYPAAAVTQTVYEIYPPSMELNSVVAAAIDFTSGGLALNGTLLPSSAAQNVLVTNEPLQLAGGGTVTVGQGYEFRICTYDSYGGNDRFSLRDARDYTGEPYQVPADCIALISLRKTDGAAFSRDERINASQQIRCQLRNPSVRDVIDRRITSADLYQVLEIPATAAEFYALFERTIPAGCYEKTELVSAEETADAPVYLYKFSKNNAWESSNYKYRETQLYPKKKILLVGGVHGNERTSPTAILSFANNLTKNPAYTALLGSYAWYLIPLVNPWGYSHSLLTSAGDVVYHEYGKYTGTVPQGYALVENTPLIRGGIRNDAWGRDINRDYADDPYTYNGKTYGFTTPQTNAIRRLCMENGFSLAVDLHQSQDARDAGMAPSCGYASMQYQAEQTALQRRFFTAINGANAKTDSYFRDRYGLDGEKDLSLIWNGSDQAVMRNYLAGIAVNGRGNTAHPEIAVPYSVCIETSQVCYPIAKMEEQWYNGVATTYTNNYLINVLEALAPLVET